MDLTKNIIIIILLLFSGWGNGHLASISCWLIYSEVVDSGSFEDDNHSHDCNYDSDDFLPDKFEMKLNPVCIISDQANPVNDCLPLLDLSSVWQPPKFS
jgi:hypothetical protein